MASPTSRESFTRDSVPPQNGHFILLLPRSDKGVNVCQCSYSDTPRHTCAGVLLSSIRLACFHCWQHVVVKCPEAFYTLRGVSVPVCPTVRPNALFRMFRAAL